MKIKVNSYEIGFTDFNYSLGPKTREEFIEIIVEQIEYLARLIVSRSGNKFLEYEGEGFYYDNIEGFYYNEEGDNII